jgi:hypothetical protein
MDTRVIVVLAIVFVTLSALGIAMSYKTALSKETRLDIMIMFSSLDEAEQEAVVAELAERLKQDKQERQQKEKLHHALESNRRPTHRGTSPE